MRPFRISGYRDDTVAGDIGATMTLPFGGWDRTQRFPMFGCRTRLQLDDEWVHRYARRVNA
jgi:hypothetical protein